MTRFGYLVPTREAVMSGAPATGPLLDLAVRAEKAGYDGVWVGDSLLARPRHDPLTLLAAIAAATETVTLGTAVLLPAYRNPVVLAQQLATLDQLSAGRLVVGCRHRRGSTEHPGRVRRSRGCLSSGASGACWKGCA